MEQGVVMQNSFGVTIRIKTCSPCTSPLASSISAQSFFKSDPLPATNKVNDRFYEQSKVIIRYVLIGPIWLAKKIGRLFLANPYHYPLYPFHFPILIYGPHHSFGYYPDTHLVESLYQEDSVS